MPIKLITVIFIFFNTTVFAHNALGCNTADSLKKDSTPARFPGGEEKFAEYLKSSIRYPVISRLKGKEGKVLLSFVVDTNGRVGKVKIEKGLDPYCNQEAVKSISQSPDWVPATIKGKKTDYTCHIPVVFKDTFSIAAANVMINGNLLKSYKELKKADLHTQSFGTIEPALAKAIFGAEYDKKLVVLNNNVLSASGYDEAHFKNTFNMLRNIDTSKVQLNIEDKVCTLDEWRKYLNKDSLAGMFIYPSANSSLKPLDKNKAGILTLATKSGVVKQQQARAGLLQNIADYRSGKLPLPKEMIIIDGWNYKPEAVFGTIDTGVIKYVSIVSAEKAVNLYGNNYKNGIIYIYTKRYQYTRPYDDKQQLAKLVEQYKKENKAPNDHLVFLNDMQPIDFEGLKNIQLSDVEYVNIISKEEARAFFGSNEQHGIIYISSSKIADVKR